jgi:prophage antirepressor-like protein
MHHLIPLFFEGKRIVAFTSNNVHWFNFYELVDALEIDDEDGELVERLGKGNWTIADIGDPEIRETTVVINLAGLCKLVSFSGPDIAGRFMWWFGTVALPSCDRPKMAVLAGEFV